MDRVHPPALEPRPGPAAAKAPRERRNPHLLRLASLAPATFLCVASAIAGGLPELTDLGMLALTIASLLLVLRELPDLHRYGRVGPLVVYVGVVMWFCLDYLENWAGKGPREPWSYSPALVARVAALHCVFVMGMTVGLAIPWGNGLPRLLNAIPEPRSKDAYVWIILFLFGLGLIPYVFLSTDPILVTFERAVTGFYAGGASFTFSRTGNLNYDWSGYLFELIKVGRFGGVLAGVYALRVAHGPARLALGWSIWGFWVALAFGSGCRGQLLFMVMPLLLILLMDHGGAAGRLVLRHRLRAAMVAAGLAFGLFGLMQVQSQLRSQGIRSAKDLGRIDLGDLQGNHMFSEGLAAWELIPDRTAPFHDGSGEGPILALPLTVFRIAVHPIPRALWNSKPVDPVWAWHNELTVGTVGATGTTVSTGLVGWWYFRYGLIGMLEGAVFMGWLFAAGDLAMRRARGSRAGMSLLVCMGFMAWLFRCFRDLAIGELYEMVIAAVFLALLLKVLPIGSTRTVPAGGAPGLAT